MKTVPDMDLDIPPPPEWIIPALLLPPSPAENILAMRLELEEENCELL